MNTIIDFASSTIRISVPIIMLALGVCYSEKAGVHAMGAEGHALIAAFVSVIMTIVSGSLLCGIIFGIEYCLAVFPVVFVYFFVAAQGSEFVVGGCKFIFGFSFTPSEIIAFVYRAYCAYCPVRPHQAAGQTEVYILMPVLKFFFRRLRGCAKCANR